MHIGDRLLLKTSLKLLLVLVTVGGGFTGVLELFAKLTDTKATDAPVTALLWLGLAIFSLITIAGLMFVHSPHQTRTMFAAIAVQIPWFDLPGIKYHLSSAAYVAVTLGPPVGVNRIGTSIALSSQLDSLFQARIGGSPSGDWTIGINLFAVFILAIWWLYTSPNLAGEL
jgi:hypothetical protein